MICVSFLYSSMPSFYHFLIISVFCYCIIFSDKFSVALISEHIIYLFFNAEVTSNVRCHDDGSKELNACIRFFLHMVYLSPKHKSSLFGDNMYEINMHMHIHLQWCFFWLTRPWPLSLAYPAPLHMYQPSPLLTWRSLFLCSWCEYPFTLIPGLLSTVLPLLLNPPRRHPTDQVTYLHRWHHNIWYI